MYASVIVDVNNKNVDQIYDYKIPTTLKGTIKIGNRVIVPFNMRTISGFVIDLKEQTDYKGNVKEIISLYDDYSLSNLELDLVSKIKDKYYNSYLDSLMLFIPNALKLNYKTRYKIIDYDNLDRRLFDFIHNDYLKFDKLNTALLNIINSEINLKHLEKEYIIDQKLKENKEKYYIYESEYLGKGSKAKELLNYIKEGKKSRKEIIAKFGVAALNTLISNNSIKEVLEENYKLPHISDMCFPDYKLNEAQDKAFREINFNSFKEYLLFGVTSSGKTILYVKLIEEALKNNKGAMLLVPEISLTPQMSILLKNKFQDDIAIIHSNLSSRVVFDEQRRIRDGKAKIVIGARSAIFNIPKNLGIIIIDEEHSDSYYQENKPNYDAREVASMIAKKMNIPLVLASATPRISSYYLALENKYKLLTLPKRYLDREMPKVEVVDMRQELKKGNLTVLSKSLEDAINNALNNHKQIILFINRRGFSSSVMCRNCGHVIKCKNCDIPLNYHKNSNLLKCHHCDYTIKNVEICPVCGSKKIRYVGIGIEKIEEFIKNKYKDYVVNRLDSDICNKKDVLEQTYLEFYNHKIDILIGTQMVTKGLDIKDLALVGVINADMAFFYPSYDSTEVGFSLLSQVAGRSGRHSDGKVIIQTYNVENNIMDFVKNHDYIGFYNYEIVKRKRMDNPPFKNIKILKFRSLDRLEVLSECKKFIKQFSNLKNIKIIGPAQDLIFKARNYFNYHIIIKYIDEKDIVFLNQYYNNFNNKLVSLRIGDKF